MSLEHEINHVLVDSLEPGIKRIVGGLVRGGALPEEIGAFIRIKFPTQPLTAQAAQRFAELCWVAQGREANKKGVNHA